MCQECAKYAKISNRGAIKGPKGWSRTMIHREMSHTAHKRLKRLMAYQGLIKGSKDSRAAGQLCLTYASNASHQALGTAYQDQQPCPETRQERAKRAIGFLRCKRGHKGAKGAIEWITGKCPIRLYRGLKRLKSFMSRTQTGRTGY